MNSKVPVVVLILLISPILTEKTTDDDIDPFDMLNFDHASMSMENKEVKRDIPIDKVKAEESTIDEKKTKEIPSAEKEPQPQEIKIEIPLESLSKETPPVNEPMFDLRKCPSKKSPASPLFRQFVKTFLHHISNKVYYNGEYDLRLMLTTEDIDILKRYGDSETEVDIYTAHKILTGMIYNFREVSTGDKSGRHLWIEDQLGFPIEKLVQMMLAVVLIAGIIALFIHLKFSVKQLFIIVFVFFFFTSWLLTWYTLCKKEMSKQHYIISKDMPEYCKNRENQDAGLMSVTWSWLASPFRYEKDECLEYFENLIISPYIKVSPVEALAVTLTRFFVAPLSHIAEELSKALRMFLKDLPIHIAPIAMAGLLIFGGLLIFMGFGYRVSSFFLTIGPAEQNVAKQIQALEKKYEKEREDTKMFYLKEQKMNKDFLIKNFYMKSQVSERTHVPEHLKLPDHGDASSHTCAKVKSTFSKLETIPRIDCNSEVVVNTVEGFQIDKNEVSAILAANESGIVSNGNKVVSAWNENGAVSGKNENGVAPVKNENGEKPGINENGAVSDKNENGKIRPVQCTDDFLNGGVEDINVKKSAIPVIKK